MRTERRARPFATAAFAALALLALVPACRKEGAPAQPTDVATDEDGYHEEPAPEARDFKFVVAAAESKVPVGGELVFKVRVENHGDVPAKVNVPRLGRDSVVFMLRSDKVDVAWLDPIRCKESPRGPQPDPPEVKEIAKGQSVEGEIRVAAVLCGSYVFTPVYSSQALGAQLTADAVKIDVVPAADGANLGVRLETSHGTIDAKLRPDIAFQTATAFATLVRKGFYDGLKFHRVIQGFMAQGGDPQGEGWGGPGYMLRRELHGKLPHRRGVFSMARQQQPDTAGSQFFIMFGDRPQLDNLGYATFGEMIAGEDALQRIESVGAPQNADGPPREPITIRKATLLVLK